MDCKITRTKKNPNDYNLTFKGLTRGSILMLHNALMLYAQGSPLAADVLPFLKAAIKESSDAAILEALRAQQNGTSGLPV